MFEIRICIDVAEIVIRPWSINFIVFTNTHPFWILFIRSTAASCFPIMSVTCTSRQSRSRFITNNKDYSRRRINLIVKFLFQFTRSTIRVIRNTSGNYLGGIDIVNLVKIIISPLVKFIYNVPISVIHRIICTNINSFAHIRSFPVVVAFYIGNATYYI